MDFHFDTPMNEPQYTYKYTGDEKNIAIPTYIEYLGCWLFANHNEIETVKLSPILKGIHNDAFLNCTNLKYISLPDSVTDLQYEAFKGCTNLRIVKLSKNLKTIADRVFDLCDNLETIIYYKNSNLDIEKYVKRWLDPQSVKCKIKLQDGSILISKKTKTELLKMFASNVMPNDAISLSTSTAPIKRK